MTNALAINDSDDRDLEIPTTERQISSGDSATDSVVWGFMGGNGGAGVTSLCTQLAYELSRGTSKSFGRGDSAKRPRVCLLDLDFENGSCASYLDVTPGAHIEDLLPEASAVDPDLAGSLMSSYSPHLDLFAVPNSLNGNGIVDPDKVLQLLDAASQLYDYVLLDIPRLWCPWSHAAIGGSDQFYFVTELTVPALQAVRQRLQDIAAVDGLEDVDINIIVNKHERRSFRNSLRLADAEKATGKHVFFSVCTNVDAVRDAINRGEPTGVTNPESRFSKDSRELLELLLKEVPNRHLGGLRAQA